MLLATKVSLKLLIIIFLSVFQVSLASIRFSKQVSNVTTRVKSEVSVGTSRISYKLMALGAQILPKLLQSVGRSREALVNSPNRWYAQRAFKAEEDVAFFLCTKSTPDCGEELHLNDSASLRASHFNAFHPTRILIHGWLGSEFSVVFSTVAPAYLRKGKYNVINVDWGRGAIADYTTARKRVKSVGKVLARFVDFLHQESGTPFATIRLIGFSMGAHVAGIAGKHVQKGRIPVIFGLDAALPQYSFESLEDRLSTSDADYVEAIHTNAGGYGFEKAIGHTDFYVNYGNNQPGCLLAECDHFRAFKVFAESINSKIGFWARGCDSRGVYDLLKKRKCLHPNGQSAWLGGEAVQNKTKGVFYLKTNSESPFARGKRPKI